MSCALEKLLMVEVSGYSHEYPKNMRYRMCLNISVFVMNVQAPQPQYLWSPNLAGW